MQGPVRGSAQTVGSDAALVAISCVASARSKVEAGKARFLTPFPDIPADWVHEKPYYKLRAGAFRSRQEAQALIDDLKTYYPGAYTTQDSRIHVRDFLIEKQF